MGTHMSAHSRRHRRTSSRHLARTKDSSQMSVASISWIDSQTAADVVDITESVATHHPEVLAVILFGSVARCEARPVDDPQPSDVDLLLLLDPAVLDAGARRLTQAQALALTHTIGEADYRHRMAPREVKALFLAPEDLARWDPSFIENVVRDGILLWARRPLPAPFAPIEERRRLGHSDAVHGAAGKVE